MPIIRVGMLAGRTNEVKETLANKLTEAVVETLQVSPQNVRVLLHEVETEHWFIGGKPSSPRYSTSASSDVDKKSKT